MQSGVEKKINYLSALGLY